MLAQCPRHFNGSLPAPPAGAAQAPINSLVLLPAFGAGLPWCAHYVRWGERVTPKGTTDVDLPPCDKTALEMVQEQIRKRETTLIAH